MKTKIIYKIDADILKASDECARHFSCLFSKKEYCEIDKYIKGDGEVIFVKPSGDNDCRYLMPFGFSSSICNCPTRAAIYRKYGT
ncbi:MAG: hypothetical protein AMK71_10125 [Nitrospira bacterium SG8_35_4]|nr:MAG: hypothetical protein AMK71_10125 [Nitrospira bacterium SG8_35_4]